MSSTPRKVGVLGGGQLGRMFAEAANLLGEEVQVKFLDAPGSSAKQVTGHDGHINGSFKDRDAIRKLAQDSDIVTIEIEHVDTNVLEHISKEVDVQPSWKTIRMIQDKFLQKEHLKQYGVATTESIALEKPTAEELEKASIRLGLPLMLKSRKEAYDGRGNYPVKTQSDFKAALETLGGNEDLYAEKWASFKMELAVMVIKTKDGVLSYPTTETIHENSICKLTYTPARGISREVDRKAQELAKKAVGCFWGKGVFGVEMFLLENDEIVINELAPRPHNSGHYTIEGCRTSQFRAHLAAILDRPLFQEHLELREPSIMLNILGGDTPDSHLKVAREAEKNPFAAVHLYGKGEARKGRKMGHITVSARTMSRAQEIIQPLIDLVDEGKSKVSMDSPRPPKQKAVVAVVMGSDSDLPVVQPGLDILEKFRIPHTVRITSAHRTPQWMAEYASNAEANGIKVIVAAAGGAAHLPGMAASETPLPVIGIPVKPTIGDGLDSVLSILNMPRGVPVATVSVNNSTNAALLAIRILGADNAEIRAQYSDYVRKNKEEVLAKDLRLLELGPKVYAERYLNKK